MRYKNINADFIDTDLLCFTSDEHEGNIVLVATDELIDIINVECDSAIISFNVDDIFAQDVAFYLNKYNICVRAGNHCAKILKNATKVNNTIRVSLYFYNTEKEIDEFIELISNKDKILKEMF